MAYAAPAYGYPTAPNPYAVPNYGPYTKTIPGMSAPAPTTTTSPTGAPAQTYTQSPSAVQLTNLLSTPPAPISQPPSIQDLLPQITSAMGPAPSIQAPSPLMPQFAQYAPTPLQGYSQDYYTAKTNELKDALRQEYFGPLGTVQQTASGESAAGRLGSGVGEQILQEAALKPFNQAYTQIDEQMLQQQEQDRLAVAQFNSTQQNEWIKVMSTLAQTDSTNQLDAAKANGLLQSQFQQMAMQAATAEQGELGREATAQLEDQLRVWEQAVQSYTTQVQLAQQAQIEQQKNMIAYLGTPLNNPSPSQTNTAQQLTNMFGTGGSSSGSSSTPTGTNSTFGGSTLRYL